jgi:hypothetical protein
MIPIDQALLDRKLLGAALGDAASWSTWLTVLKAAHGLDLTKTERKTFSAIAGGRKPPRRPCNELWCVCGRRSGKSRMAALTSVYCAAFLDHKAKLAPGETGFVLCLSPTLAQAQLVFSYCLAFLESSPILKQKIIDTTSTEIRLEGNITISTHPNSFRSVRGRTLLSVVFDESAFWRDEASANPDLEVYRAILPALASTQGMLIGISSPYRRTGLLHQKHRDCFGINGGVLVVQGKTEWFNPLIDRKMIAKARADDPAAALSEWDGLFRSDLSQFVGDEQIDAAVNHSRPLELPPVAGQIYHVFTDASAGRHDHFTICIGHKDGERFICDVIRGKKPPFDPNAVAAEYAALTKSYRCTRIIGDAYAGEWVAQAFKKCGIDYHRSSRNRSELYLESLPFWMRGAVSIPDHSRLIRELRLLERRTAPSGQDKVDHGHGGSDDFANALCGAIHLTMREPRGSAFAYVPGFAAKAFDGDGAQIGGGVRMFGQLPANHVLPGAPDFTAAQANLTAEKVELEARMNRKPGEPPAPPSPYAMFSSKCFGA